MRMATIQPKGEKIRSAVKWISQSLQDDPASPFRKLIEEACQKFNLSPLDEEYLVSFYSDKKGTEGE
jgi:hypothetical protein